jgi:hypothetical protein
VESIVSNDEIVVNSSIKDGDLIRAKGDYRVYIVKGNYKRHVISSDIFSFYGHLGWSSIKEVSAYDIAQYKDSNFVRADGDKKVYEIDENGQKHWLDITGEEFVTLGHDWESVYVINNAERDFYVLGTDVKS